jgi:hypothetical protein
MHATYIPESIDYWIKYYEDSIKSSQFQLGGDLDGFRAAFPFHQRGGGLGSFFKSMFRLAMPLFKSAGIHALSAGSKIAADLAKGRNLKESFSEHGRDAAGNMLHETADMITKQKGKGVGTRIKRSAAVPFYKRKKQTKPKSFGKSKAPKTVGFLDIYSKQNE